MSQPQEIFLKDYKVPEYLIDETYLDFNIASKGTVVKSKLMMRVNTDSKEEFAPLVLNGEYLDLQYISINGTALCAGEDYRVDDDSLTVFAVPDEKFSFECEVLIEPHKNTALEGLFKSGKMFCTQCESQGFRRITYYLDRPDVMSKFTVAITADEKKYPTLLSNGNRLTGLDDESLTPEAKKFFAECANSSGDDEDMNSDLNKGSDLNSVLNKSSVKLTTKHCVLWQDPHPKPSYLFALVAGKLEHVDDKFTTMSGREVLLRIFIEPENVHKTQHALDSLKKSMKWDEERFGREYDLDIFMIVAVNDFNMGAMENKGLNIFNSSCVLASTDTATDTNYEFVEAIVAHEYFHNWSGNRVTCRDWFQLSLKEGFTVFRDSEFTSDMQSRAVKRIEDASYLRTHQFAEDASPMAHPVRGESFIEISNFYTLTVYEKGCEVVRMIHTLLGEETFRKGTDLYFERHDGQAVTVEDFVQAMVDASIVDGKKEDLKQFQLWYSQACTPEVKVTARHNKKEGVYTLSFTQSCPADAKMKDKKPFHIPIKLGLLASDGSELELKTDDENFNIETGVFSFKEDKQTLVFTEVAEKPVPSLLRDFSAPIKLEYKYSRDDLAFLMSNDSDAFMRWDAGQRLAIEIMQEQIKNFQNDEVLEMDTRLVDSFRTVLKASANDEVDLSMISLLLTLPAEAYLSEMYKVIDVDAIHEVRNFMRQHLATELKEEFLEVYKANRNADEYKFEYAQASKRRLANVCLGYLAETAEEEMLYLVWSQFATADNMTDEAAAFAILANCDDATLRSKATSQFYDKWQDDTVVLDKWFAVQSGADIPEALENVVALTEHKDFDIKNPNKVRSVIGAFANQNVANFHRVDGEGYKFLADNVITLNKLNPSIAARLVRPLIQWKRYDSMRQEMMKSHLERIAKTKNLSNDVYEIVSRGLAS